MADEIKTAENVKPTGPGSPPAEVTAPEAKMDPKPSKGQKLSAGARVRVVTASQEKLDAKIVSVRDTTTVDLKFQFREAEMVITASPFDESQTQPDSWHWPE